MPSPAADLEPAEVPTQRRGAKDGVRVLGGLGVRQAHPGGDGVVDGVEGQQRDPHVQERVDARRVPVVRVLGRVAPGRALVGPVELVEVLDLGELG